MLAEIYIEALLVDVHLTGEVWELWKEGKINDQMAWLAWWLITVKHLHSEDFLLP